MFQNNETKNRRIFIFCLFFLLFSLFYSQKIFAQSENPKIQQAIQKANELKLYEDDFWKILLLYEKKIGGYKSPVETPAFFLAKDGRTNPKSEMEADIKAFLNGESIKFFPARFKYLKEKLNLSDSDFPENCEEEYFSMKKNANPTAVHLVFPAGYMSNPASMFGHTFLLFENENKPKLLGQSVSYGAVNTNTPGFIYALKGLFGLYYGSFAVDMYSKQILKYKELDMRDIWEYKLKLSDEQLDMLLRHTLELALVLTKYYYINKNCTYYLTALLESAYPNENLLKKIGKMAEPLEAVKLFYEKGLTEEPTYRPSLSTLINTERKIAGDDLSYLVKKYCKGKIEIESLLENCKSEDEKSIALKLSNDYLRYLLASSKITQDEYKVRIMKVFSSLSKIKNKQEIEITSSDYPHKSHDSKKIALTFGLDDKNAFSQTYFRLVNHDLIDDDKGLNKNTELSFVTGSFSIYMNDFLNEGIKSDNLKFKLDTLDFVHIKSLPISDSFYLNKAIDVVAGLERNQISKDDDDLALRLKLFAGTSFKIFSPNQFFILAGLDLYTNPNYDFFVDLLPGIEFGLLTTKGIWKQQLTGTIEQGIFKNDDSSLKDNFIGKKGFTNRDRLRIDLSIEERFSLSRNTAISAKYNFYGDYKDYNHKIGITGHFNF